MMCLHAQRAIANFEKSFGENKGPVVELTTHFRTVLSLAKKVCRSRGKLAVKYRSSEMRSSIEVN